MKAGTVSFQTAPLAAFGVEATALNLHHLGDQIAATVGERVEGMRDSLPVGIELPEWSQIMDFSQSIRESVAETQFALIFGAILATLVVFVFLRRSRPTFIVAAAIPLSLTATFGVMWLAGATLNIMTLLALALAAF